MRLIATCLAFASLASISLSSAAIPSQQEATPPPAATSEVSPGGRSLFRALEKRRDQFCRRYASPVTVFETVTSISASSFTESITSLSAAPVDTSLPLAINQTIIAVTTTISSNVTFPNATVITPLSGGSSTTSLPSRSSGNSTSPTSKPTASIAALIQQIPTSSYPDVLKALPQADVYDYCGCKPLALGSKIGIIVGVVVGGLLVGILGFLLGRFAGRKKVEIHAVCDTVHGVNDSCPVWQKHPAFVAAEMMRQADNMEKPDPGFRNAAYQLFGTAVWKESQGHRGSTML